MYIPYPKTISSSRLIDQPFLRSLSRKADDNEYYSSKLGHRNSVLILFVALVWGTLLLWPYQDIYAAENRPVVDSYEDGSNINKPRPFLRSPVQEVIIEENGARSAAGQTAPDDCSRFEVSVAQVKQYFARARRVSKRAYTHELDWSPCIASGTLTLADGRRAQWGLQQYGLGWLSIDNRLSYFYCTTCSAMNLTIPPK